MSSSSIDPHLASQSYSFLPKILKDDLSALRTAVQMAQKAEKTCPLSAKPARVAEREMLELQLGKLRTKIERGEREAKEREVLAGAKREENSKRKEGKGAWYMKKSMFLLFPFFFFHFHFLASLSLASSTLLLITQSVSHLYHTRPPWTRS
jgi:ribosomal RNA-processing protein 36